MRTAHAAASGGAAWRQSATLLYRLVAYWLPIPAGGVAYLLFRRRYHVGDQVMQPRPTPDA